MQLPIHETHLLVGASSAGKSTLMLQIIKATQESREFIFGLPGKRIAYVTSDRGRATIDKQIKRLGLTDIEHYSAVEDRRVSDSIIQNRLALMTMTLQNVMKPFDVLVLDPVALFLPPNLNHYHSAACGMLMLNRLAHDRKVTIIGIHHATKMKSDADFLRPQDRISGSAALQAFSSTQVVLIQGLESKKVNDDVYVIHHHAPLEHYRLVRDTEGWFAPYAGQTTSVNDLDSQLGRAVMLITDLAEEFTCHDAVDHGVVAGISEKTVKRAIANLVSSGALMRTGRGSYQKGKQGFLR